MSLMSLAEHNALLEAQIKFSGGAKYGQAVFLGGGGGSGKGYAYEKFMAGEDFRTIDVDRYKQQLIQLGKSGKPGFEKFADMDLRNPDHVFNMHMMVKKMGIRHKVLNAFFKGAAQSPGRLPNIMFDTTMKDMGDLEELIPELIKVGYHPTNIHLIWVLANYGQAVAANKNRSRVVPDDVLLQTHEGAARTMMQIMGGHVLPHGLDGKIVCILNNREETKTHDQRSNMNSFSAWNAHRPGQSDRVVDKFSYIIVKREGKPLDMGTHHKAKVSSWVRQNVPKTVNTKHMWRDDPKA